ncbi:MAG: hypothetical protein A3A80_03750 [Candidatus Terrybacteria bacterium RIFCSPLOWO2_01_FULL_44_24]|uniref:PPM-type phosphatase domain-containing protein n=1 Tax=Candidatus Terrybacteria bacterium RIFCSPHIGHO2_01_FULL_43_35 TaxID=1802361 RepID=A0A1G2PFZ4_9BACT|nr:MAG: hypothetical protein A2828_00080 [Candidatus Terrybacteria bacterium RIFCSPHIGHO2_01_FULL_43_35]OHA49306.1 MAG: hypothetical protein A3B75_02455 [Candidatus Terrybacteria bacterium RIFCSPHIGHO2_02_FULL_43_14]OHA52004.1 MAG: hypothetical protein A3A80_03750 [Candidatus Terrybacteria bacterium RIFCSPLOWO2_01_FULL_44_24]
MQKPNVKEFLLNGAEGDIFCDILSFEPPQGMEKLGVLFVAAELRGAPRASWGIPNLITSAMRRSYFEKDTRKPLQAFTIALKEANAVLMHELSSGNEGWLGSSSFVTFVINHQTILASRAGSNAIGVWLIRNSVRSDIFSSDSRGMAPFSSIVSGRIEDNDIIFAGSADSFSSVTENSYDLKEIYRLVQQKITERSASCAFVINIPANEMPKHALAPLLNSSLMPRDLSILARVSKPLIFTQPIVQKLSEAVFGLKEKLTERLFKLPFVLKFKKNAPAWLWSINISWTVPVKSALVGIILVAAVFGLFKSGLYAVNHLKKPDNKSTQTVSQIQKDLDGARAAMIYGDKKQAAKLLEEAGAQISLLAQNKLSQKIIAPLTDSWKEMNAQLFSIKNSVSEKFLVLKGFPIPFKPQRIYLTTKADDQEILSFTDSEVGAIYRYSVKDKKGSIKLRSEKGGFIGVLPGDKRYLYVVGKDGITLYDENAENFASTLPYDHKENILFGASGTSFALLGNVQSGQILKISIEQDGLKNSGTWLKKPDKATLNRILDAAWDGKSLWMLRDDGNILRYTNGTRNETIILSGVQNDFHADRLELAPGPELLILDSKTGKIVRFNKKGVAQTQYIDESIKSSNDFTLSANGKTAYVLVGNVVEKLSLN